MALLRSFSKLVEELGYCSTDPRHFGVFVKCEGYVPLKSLVGGDLTIVILWASKMREVLRNLIGGFAKLLILY